MNDPIPHRRRRLEGLDAAARSEREAVLADLTGTELSDEARRDALRNQRRRRAMDERLEPILLPLLSVGVVVSIVVVAVGLASWRTDIIQTGLVALGGFCGGAALERRSLFRRRS